MKLNKLIVTTIVFISLFSHRYSFAGEWDRMPSKSLPRLEKVIASGLNHSIVIGNKEIQTNGVYRYYFGLVYTVGRNDFGQLGRYVTTLGNACDPTWIGDENFNAANRWLPPPPLPSEPIDPSTSGTCVPLDSVFYVAAGWNFNLAVRADGTVYSWGDNSSLQLGREHNGTSSDCARQVLTREPGFVSGNQATPITNIIAVAAGKNHALALRSDGTVWSWGSNIHGQLGLCNNFNPAPTAFLVKKSNAQGDVLTNIIAIACGDDHSLALAADGTLWTWGSNEKGQIGNGNSGTNNDVFCPVKVIGVCNSGNQYLTNVVSIDGGALHSVAVLASGNAVAWGDNQYHQLGINDPNNPQTITCPRYMYGTNINNNNISQLMYVSAISTGKYSETV